MNKFKRESRYYPAIDKNGRETFYRVTYTLYFTEEDALFDVRNEYGHSVESNSEVWEFFNNKYN